MAFLGSNGIHRLFTGEPPTLINGATLITLITLISHVVLGKIVVVLVFGEEIVDCIGLCGQGFL